MSTAKILAILITYNSSDYIEKCLDSLITESKSSKNNISILVIDNYSDDDTVTLLSKYSKKINIIKNNQNLGFSRAVNQGLNYKNYDYYLLINPDGHIKHGSIDTLVLCSVVNNADICGGKTVSEDGNPQGDHFRIPNLFVGIFDFSNLRKISKRDYWHKYFYYLDEINNHSDVEVGSVTGGFMLISIKAINTLGKFNEKYFMYLEDVEYCKRAHDNGLRVFYCPNAVMIHRGGGSSSNKERANLAAWYDSRKYYFYINHNLIDNIVIQPIFFIDKIFTQIKQKYNENFHN